MITEQKGLEYLDVNGTFSKQEYFNILRNKGYSKTLDSFFVFFQKLINDGLVQRVGRNIYQIAKSYLNYYNYSYSNIANDISVCIKNNHNYLNYVIFETIQLNEFINHQIGRNTIFVFADNEVIDFVFNTLKFNFKNIVMLSPSIKEFNQYRSEDTIVLRRLVSESPQNPNKTWQIMLEKLLVDIMAEDILKEILPESEYKFIYENAFNKYIIDESKMFRYANRRGIAEEIREFIKNETTVSLKVGQKNDK